MLAIPLYKSVENKSKFEWGDEQKTAFIALKSNWKNALELKIPDLSKSFKLETDASDSGLGVVLKQGEEVIAYISRALRQAEKSYSITEKETLAVIWACEKFEYHLFGREFELVTDHKAIEQLKLKIEFGSHRIKRWFERLEKFNFKVTYRKGCEMTQADAMSRSVSDVSNEIKVLEVHEDLNHRKTIGKELKKMGVSISENELKRILTKCFVCAKKDKLYGRFVNMVETTRPGELVSIDMCEISGKERIIVMIDYFTRKVYAKMVTTKEARKILEFIKDVYKNFKFKRLLADNGKEFKNNLLLSWANMNNVEIEFSLPIYHASNGRVERAIRTI